MESQGNHHAFISGQWHVMFIDNYLLVRRSLRRVIIKIRFVSQAHAIDLLEANSMNKDITANTRVPYSQIRTTGAKLEFVELRELTSRIPSRQNDSLNLRQYPEGSGRVSTSEGAAVCCGSGLGVVRAWLSHVSKPFLALGPTKAVYSWCDPYRAELELRHRLNDLAADDGKRSGTFERIIHAFSDIDVVMWSKDVANEAKAERARLLHHLGICLHQQIARYPIPKVFDMRTSCGKINRNSTGSRDTGSNDSLIRDFATTTVQGWAGASRRGRHEVAMAATEALSRAHELGVVEADYELRALKTGVVAEDEEAGSDTKIKMQAKSSEGSDFKMVSDLDSDESIAQLLEEVALVTISNLGYSDYTLNAMASLRIHCQLSCALQVRQKTLVNC